MISRNVFRIASELVPRFDAFQDNPWPVINKFLDDTYPESKFILTIRPAESWISSVIRYFGNEYTPMRKWIYGVGSPIGNEKIYIERFNKHNDEVREYFRGRGEAFLEMDLFQGDGWAELCDFLGHPVPDEPFPHLNRSFANT